MISRRDLVIGGLLVGASAASYALTPRRKMSLLAGGNLEKMIPTEFGGWKHMPTDAIVVPEEEDSLAAKLYSESVGRAYVTPDNQAVMLLIAYGDTQSDSLQLHRPEVCYPAFGFNLSGMGPTTIDPSPAVRIPGRHLTASSVNRTEHIVYWTRIGEYLPDSGGQQRLLRLRSEMDGWIPDGVLVRISSISHDAESALALNRRFGADLIRALSPAARRVLIGTELTRSLQG